MHHPLTTFALMSALSVIDYCTAVLLLSGIGLLVLLSHGKRFRLFRKVFGPSRTRLTLEGKLFLILSGVICTAAINTRINLMYLVAGLMLSALLVSVVFSRSVQKIKVRRSAPGRIHAGEPVTIRLNLKSPRRRVTVFTVMAQDHVAGPAAVDAPPATALQLRPGAAQSISYRCTFPRRGVYRFTHVVLKSRFPFGLFEMQFEQPIEQEVVVYPAIGRIKHLPSGHAGSLGQIMLPLNAVGQDDFSHLRDYRPDDNPRRIHWRTSARLGKLHVMEFRGLPARTAEILFDPAIRDDSSAAAEGFEKAARFAATISEHLASQDYSLRFSLDGNALQVGPGKRILPEILESLARAEPKIGGDPAAHQGNGAPALRIRVTIHGKCRADDHHVVAAACDPELDRWFADSEGRA